MQNIAKVETEEVPSILTSEVERALSQMKNSKAPGEDQRPDCSRTDKSRR